MTLNVDGLNVRLVAYAPDGARIGILPMATTYTISDVLNDVSSLQMTYSSGATKSELLSTPVEIAAEYANAAGDAWTEMNNGRFIRLESDGDPTDETGSVAYQLPGYAWQLGKVVVVVSAAQRARTGKRSFGTASCGETMRTLLMEAQGRGCLPGLTYDFTNTTDSNGDAWRHDVIGLAFDPGTTYMTVLKAMSDGGLVDWRMRGRTLQMFNPMGEMAAQRATARAVTEVSTINLNAFLDNLVNTATTDSAAAYRPDTDDSARHGMNGFMVAQHGYPVFNPIGYQLTTGPDSTLGAAPANRPIAMYGAGSSPDGITRQLGAIVCNWNSPARWFYGVPIPDASLRPDKLIQNAWNRNSGHMLLAESVASVRQDISASTGYSYIGRHLITSGLACIELVCFDVSEYTNSNVIVQGGAAGYDTTLRSLVHSALVAVGGMSVRSDIGATSLSGIRPAIIQPASALGTAAKAGRTQYARVAVSNQVMNNATLVNRVASALDSALSSLPNGRFLQFVSAKRATDPDDPTFLGPVDLRVGRDLIEAPTHRSLTEMTSRVYAYGDAWSAITLTNNEAAKPWGIWETAMSQGGVNDTDTLETMASKVIDNGAAEKVSFTRGVSYQAARWYPGHDYDVGDYVSSNDTTGAMVPMRIYQSIIKKDADGISGSLVMGDRFLPLELKRSQAIVAASGGSVGGTATGGAGVRVMTPYTETRKASKVVIT